jgi:Fe-S-cluster containining protein
MPDADPRARLQRQILDEAPRLRPDDTFRFACHPGVPCFTRCCADVNIFLSPYDVLRLKRKLGLSSREFLETYTLLPVQKDMTTPVVMLRMTDAEGKPCPFLGAGGCTVYADRPWPCRMYPLGLAAQKDAPNGEPGERFCFLLREAECRGFDEPRQWTVRQWYEDQHIDAYDVWGDAFKELTLHPFFASGGVLSPDKLHMFFTACYDVDTFREFVFGSTLLQRFEVDEDFVAEMRYDDEALLRFAFLWVRFSLFGEPTVKPRPEVLEAFRGRLDKRELFGRPTAAAPAEDAR